MTREEAIGKWIYPAIATTWNENKCKEILEALEQEPCDDAISRQATIDVIERWLKCSDYNEAERHIMRAMQSELYDLPSVASQPKIGNWIYKEHDIAMCNGYSCNQCGFFVSWDYQHKFIDFIKDYSYCPNCGAKLVEPQESED